jgi:ATP-dependent Clp endopeptidase proteolytic subunit ClpP
LRIDTEAAQRTERSHLADDYYMRVYRFTTDVSAASAAKCMGTLALWSRLTPECDIEIVFNSPGGSVVDGMALFDFIQDIRDKGHIVTTSCLGMAASMAGILLQAGDKRTMGRQSWLMIHEASFGAAGKIGEVEDTYEWVKRVQDRILDIFAERSNLDRAELAQNWLRKDWWLSSDEALGTRPD